MAWIEDLLLAKWVNQPAPAPDQTAPMWLLDNLEPVKAMFASATAEEKLEFFAQLLNS